MADDFVLIYTYLLKLGYGIRVTECHDDSYTVEVYRETKEATYIAATIELSPSGSSMVDSFQLIYKDPI